MNWCLIGMRTRVNGYLPKRGTFWNPISDFDECRPAGIRRVVIVVLHCLR